MRSNLRRPRLAAPKGRIGASVERLLDEAGWTIGKAMSELVELNERQTYSYSRDELIQLLDATMTAE